MPGRHTSKCDTSIQWASLARGGQQYYLVCSIHYIYGVHTVAGTWGAKKPLGGLGRCSAGVFIFRTLVVWRGSGRTVMGSRFHTPRKRTTDIYSTTSNVLAILFNRVKTHNIVVL